MNIKWKKHFYFTKTERNGIFILACLCVLFWLSPRLIPLLKKKEKTDFSEFQREIEVFENALKALENELPPKAESELFAFDPNVINKADFKRLGLSDKVAQTVINYRNKGGKFYKKEDFKKIYGLKTSDYTRLEPFILIGNSRKSQVVENKTPRFTEKKLQPFPFDPNTADREELLQLGLKEKTVQTILNYRNKGGTFRQKADFRRIYTLSDRDYLTLEPYIQIAQLVNKKTLTAKVSTPKAIPSSYEQPALIKVDINRASAEEWQQLKGIGPVYAKKIINFRTHLGGFAAIEQVGTTYGLPDSVFQKIKGQLLLSPVLNKIFINKCSVETLQRHPYIKTKQAHIIINYRTNHGYFKGIEDFRQIKALSPAFISNIQPYLSFDTK